MSSTSSPATIFDDPVFEEQGPRAYPSLKHFWLLFPAILVLFLILIISLGIYEGISRGAVDSANYLIGPLSIVVYVLITAYAYSQKKKREPAYVPSFRMPPISVMLLLVAIIPALTVSFICISAWFHVDVWDTLMHSQNSYYPDNIFVTTICVTLFTFLDHVLNRGILLDGLLKRYRPAVAIVNSVLFTSLLYMVPVAICFYLLFNLLYSWVYYYTRSLLPCLWASFVLIIFSYLIDNHHWQKLLDAGDMIATSIALVVLVMGVLLLQKIFNKTNK
ncbi:CPBP family intramembrane glutamic endopeptidase [Chitinophaga varians]|uniref:CPBP family intramembrane glutamic endopeptidase n=1 Tax=Chitinophaga varians TaxID=2202339 RepID=UPI00165F8132|nr:CPBP family intramembrane glutamic endopeptidase [Chitinophaga varians]MBC9910517.1 hypothetical protein [Chitinophaga varians]